MIVLDASAAVDWLLQTSTGQRIDKRIYSPKESLHASHLLDLEVAQVLMRLVLGGMLSARRADEAIQDLVDLRIARYPHSVLLPRIWQLRHNPSMPRTSGLRRYSATAGWFLLPAMRRQSSCFDNRPGYNLIRNRRRSS